jgi:hypothetical protein
MRSVLVAARLLMDVFEFIAPVVLCRMLADREAKLAAHRQADYGTRAHFDRP